MVLFTGYFGRALVSVLAVSFASTVLRANEVKPAPGGYAPLPLAEYSSRVLFGDVHVHTGLSADAGGGGTRLMPADAYRFARGERVLSNSGLQAQLRRPYDFLAVADHSDGMGLIADILRGEPTVMADPYGRELHHAFREGGQVARKAVVGMIARFAQGDIPPTLNYQPGNPAYRSTWETIVRAAQDYNDPGTFTTMIAYEWTSLVAGDNLHRVVLLRDAAERALQIEPYTTTAPVGSADPRDLWKWMAQYEQTTGGRVMAIPHNANLSNGMMFPLVDDFQQEAALDAAYLRERARWEPLVEVTQPKGDGEAHPLLSPDDEFADFETWDNGNLDLSAGKTEAMLYGEYAREALKRGLMLAQRDGVNPYQFGMIGSSDIHTALSTPDEDNFFGKTRIHEPSARRAQHIAKQNVDLGLKRYGWQYATPGLVAVWARANTRQAIFDAMSRKETYATTGTRMRVRFFGGFDFDDVDAVRADAVSLGYTKGVPMGATLESSGQRAPAFLVLAQRDEIGANLDRVQIVKGWIDAAGSTHEKVYDVAWSGDRKPLASGKLAAVGNTVDVFEASWTNTIGAAELSAVWSDPDFDPRLAAFYYARVIEIPTPRWTAYDAQRFALELPAHIPMTLQERAYTSPIWYQP